MPVFPDAYAHDPALPPQRTDTGLPARRGWVLLVIQLAVLVIVSILIAVWDLDRTLSSRFYTAESGWYLARKPLWAWLHQYGTIPGLVLTLTALAGWGAGAATRRLAWLRRPCMVVALTSIIAAGLLVNAVFKQYWGRPRPDQTIEFGGRWQYRHILPPGTPGKGASFPCGHCTMGFIFLSMAAFRRYNRCLAYSGVGAGIVLGGLLSAARVVQGAHFLSDTLWSLGLITMTATALCMLPSQRHKRAQPLGGSLPRRTPRPWLPLLLVGALSLAAAGFLTRRPYYQTRDYPFELGPEVTRIELQINADPERVHLQYAAIESPRLQVEIHGYGWIKFNLRMRFKAVTRSNTLELTIHSDPLSYFAELDHALTLILPVADRERVVVFFRGAAVDVRGSAGQRHSGPAPVPVAVESQIAPACDFPGNRP
jgi:membrane-associated PAP2 superfamily phosphatase